MSKRAILGLLAVLLIGFVAACSVSERGPTVLKVRGNNVSCVNASLTSQHVWCKFQNGKWTYFSKNEVDNYYDLIQQ